MEALEAVLREDPGHAQAQALLAEARRRSHKTLPQRILERLSPLLPPRTWLPVGLAAALVLLLIGGAILIPSWIDGTATPTLPPAETRVAVGTTELPTPPPAVGTVDEAAPAAESTPSVEATPSVEPTPVIEPTPLPPEDTPTHTPTPAIPVAPPDIPGEGVIAFVSERDGNREIYAVRPDGTVLTRLTNDPAPDWNPQFSPDGSQIAFLSERDTVPEVYVMDTQGLNVRRLTYTYHAGDKWFAWSPEGDRIVVEWKFDDTHRDIYLVNLAPVGQTRLTQGDGIYWNASWSPQGNRILFVFLTDRIGPDPEIFTMDATGRTMIGLTDNEYWDHAPMWSPDGSLIAFTSHREDVWSLYAMRSDGTAPPRKLIGDVNPGLPAIWSPDGSRIAVLASRDDQDEIYVMNPDGTGQIRLTRNQAADWLPTWSPDGSRLAFESDRTGRPEIYLIDADGRHEVQLTEEGGASPNWGK
jgi:TolB protein